MKKPIQVFNFSIQNSNDDSVDIYIDGDIVDASSQAIIEAWFGDTTSTSYKSFRNEINKSGAKVINVFINSPGGHVGDALAIYDLLTSIQSNGKVVNTIGRGIVASSATLILLAGKSPEMSANSWFMMHTVSGGIWGTVDQIENYAVTMRKFNDTIRDLYANKSGMRKEEVSKLMNSDTWLSAKEAKDKGFVSTVTGEVDFTNKIEGELWNINNTAILNQYNASVKEPLNQFDTMKKFFQDLGNDIMNAIKGLKPIEPKEGEGLDQQVLLNSIADTFKAPFENAGTLMETQLNTLITNAVTTAVKPFEDRVKVLEDENVTLKQKNVELANDITNKIAGKSTPNKDEEVLVPIGSFN